MASRYQPLLRLAGNPSLRRCGIGLACFGAAEYGEWIAVLVYAYDRGGASASGLLAFAQLLPAVALAPLLATFADRYPPGRVLMAGFLAQALGMGVLALALLAHAPSPLVYALAILVTPTFNLTRPTVNVLLPQTVRTPDELTAANAGVGWIESAGVVIGPLAASLAAIRGGPGAVIAVFSLLMLASAWIVHPLGNGLTRPEPTGSPFGDTIDGLRALLRERRTATLVLALASRSLFFGAMDVLFVVLAISELGMGNSGVGVLNAAFGIGGLLAVVVTLRIVGRRRLAPSMIAAALTMGGAIALIAAWPHVAGALVLLALANMARSLFEVSGRTLLQRTASPHMLGRIFGLLEAIDLLGIALGALLVPLLVSLGGTTAAIVGVGAIMPIATVALLPIILGADAVATVPVVQIGLLRSMALFRLLGPPELEGVARALEPVSAAAGDVLIREGEPGHIFYAIADGSVRVTTAAGLVRTLARGDGFGEIALLNDTPRTATVSAATDVLLYRLAREPFLAAVTGMAETQHAARALVDGRLAEQAASS
ncbi:MAG TPA: MFS transporter [Gaiellales bacterium]|jgi:predicted MFS family arabinose efflux permease